MVKKHIFYTELSYVFGLIVIALGVSLIEKSDFGVSMVVAPAYVLYRWIGPHWPVFTFGMAEYCLQAVLILLMSALLRRFRLSYLFSFVTAVVYGFVLDGCMALAALLSAYLVWQRVALYVLGMLFCSAGVAFMFHTYLSPEVYELFVKEVSAHFGVNINHFKTAYDCASCAVGIVMSFLIFGLWRFEGVKLGTVLCALVNGTIIGGFSRLYEKLWTFIDILPWRPFFEGTDKRP